MARDVPNRPAPTIEIPAFFLGPLFLVGILDFGLGSDKQQRVKYCGLNEYLLYTLDYNSPWIETATGRFKALEPSRGKARKFLGRATILQTHCIIGCAFENQAKTLGANPYPQRFSTLTVFAGYCQTVAGYGRTLPEGFLESADLFPSFWRFSYVPLLPHHSRLGAGVVALKFNCRDCANHDHAASEPNQHYNSV